MLRPNVPVAGLDIGAVLGIAVLVVVVGGASRGLAKVGFFEKLIVRHYAALPSRSGSSSSPRSSRSGAVGTT